MTSPADRPEGDDGASPVGQDRARSIPDGGLGSTMPAWLRQPPAWKRSAPPPVTRTIPPPDTSVIDPRTILDIDDLPTWLQAIAAREVMRGEQISGEQRREVVPDSEREPTVLTPGAPADSVRDSPEGARISTEAERAAPLTARDSTRPWWMSDVIIGGLLVAVILTLLYVVLVALEVI